MDHERYPYYFDNTPHDGRHQPSLQNAFINAIDILRRMLSRDPERLPTR